MSDRALKLFLGVKNNLTLGKTILLIIMLEYVPSVFQALGLVLVHAHNHWVTSKVEDSTSIISKDTFVINRWDAPQQLEPTLPLWQFYIWRWVNHKFTFVLFMKALLPWNLVRRWPFVTANSYTRSYPCVSLDEKGIRFSKSQSYCLSTVRELDDFQPTSCAIEPLKGISL